MRCENDQLCHGDDRRESGCVRRRGDVAGNGVVAKLRSANWMTTLAKAIEVNMAGYNRAVAGRLGADNSLDWRLCV